MNKSLLASSNNDKNHGPHNVAYASLVTVCLPFSL
jgi:hypothetical protein